MSWARINTTDKPPLAYHLLNVAGMHEYLLLAREFGDAPWLHLDGAAEWRTDDAGRAVLEANAQRLFEWGYGVEWLTPTDMRVIEPDVVIPNAIGRVVYSALEGYLDVAMCIGALTEAACIMGARIRTGQRVRAIIQHGGNVAGVLTDSGERIPADIVVNCVGYWSGLLMESVGFHLPMDNTPGLTAVTAPAPVRLRAVVRTGQIEIRPVGEERLLLHSRTVDRQVRDDDTGITDADAADTLWEQSVAVMPGLMETKVERVRRGVRPRPGDGFSVVGPVPGVDSCYLIATHSGVTLGPLLGRFAARELLHREADPPLAPFRPSRFC